LWGTRVCVREGGACDLGAAGIIRHAERVEYQQAAYCLTGERHTRGRARAGERRSRIPPPLARDPRSRLYPPKAKAPL